MHIPVALVLCSKDIYGTCKVVSYWLAALVSVVRSAMLSSQC
jgi:hypothetical protein